MSIFRKKEITVPVNDSGGMKKNLKTMDLIFLGIGAVVGTGIFVVTGVAAERYAGPGLVLSFLVAAAAIILSGLCYAEFASRIPVIGGPYAYMYVVFGEIVAWMTGWMIICEFFLAVSSVASGWSGYVHGFLDSLGFSLPQALSGAYNPTNGTYIDLIAMLVVVAVTFWVSLEAKTALRLNNLMVFVKFGIDAVSMAAEEVKNPKKDIPKGIIGSIVISTLLYIVVTLVLTGIVPFTDLGLKDPVAFAMRFINHGAIATIISVGAILTLLTVTIAMMYSLARVIYAISKDGLLPQFMSKIDEKRHTPKNATYVAGFLSFVFAGIVPMEMLAELTNIVTLFYLMFLALGIIKLRTMKGEPQAGEFKVPLVPVLPLISIVVCAALMFQLSLATWQVFGVAVVIGLAIYFFYGRHHSIVRFETKE